MQYKYFTLLELSCKCGHPDCDRRLPNDSFMRKLEAMREEAGFAFKLTSAGRCAHRNKVVSASGSSDGAHTSGAVDIQVYGARALRVVALAIKHGMTGIGISQKTSTPVEKRFIHVDDVEATMQRPRPWIWSY